jgi:hypothetical protein
LYGLILIIDGVAVVGIWLQAGASEGPWFDYRQGKKLLSPSNAQTGSVAH